MLDLARQITLAQLAFGIGVIAFIIGIYVFRSPKSSDQPRKK